MFCISMVNVTELKYCTTIFLSLSFQYLIVSQSASWHWHWWSHQNVWCTCFLTSWHLSPTERWNMAQFHLISCKLFCNDEPWHAVSTASKISADVWFWSGGTVTTLTRLSLATDSEECTGSAVWVENRGCFACIWFSKFGILHRRRMLYYLTNNHICTSNRFFATYAIPFEFWFFPGYAPSVQCSAIFICRIHPLRIEFCAINRMVQSHMHMEIGCNPFQLSDASRSDVTVMHP